MVRPPALTRPVAYCMRDGAPGDGAVTMPAMARWLVKEEPEHYAFAQLKLDRRITWSGVRNPLAQKHLRGMRKGDEILYYHTGKEKSVVGVARAAGDAYADPGDASGKAFVVDVEPV